MAHSFSVGLGTTNYLKGIAKDFAQNFALWQLDKSPIDQNPGTATLCTSADTKGVLLESFLRQAQYAHAIKEYRETGVPVFLTSQRSLQEIQNEKKTWGIPSLIVSNGGSLAVDSFGNAVVNESISENAAKSMSGVLGSLSNDGIVFVGTSEGTFSDSHGLGRLAVRIGLDPELFGKVTHHKFEESFTDARNITFQVLKPTEVSLKKHQIKFLGPLAQAIGWKKGALDFAVTIKRPALKNPLTRKRVTLKDIKNQEQVTRNALNALLSADPEQKGEYINDVCVTLTRNGLSFVPKGVSKTVAVAKYCASAGKDPSNIMFHGDGFDDFFLPVSLKELDKARKMALLKGEEFDPLKAFLDLSKPVISDPTTFLDHVHGYLFDESSSFSTRMLKQKMQEMTLEIAKQQTQVFQNTQIAKKQAELSTLVANIHAELESEYIPLINAATDYVSKSNLRFELQQKKKEAENNANENLKAFAEQAKNMKLNKNMLVSSTNFYGNMNSLRRRFQNFSARIHARSVAPTGPAPAPHP